MNKQITGGIPCLMFALSLFACQDETPTLPTRELGTSVAFDKVWHLGTHNSYWAERQGGDPYASGPKERIHDQLLADRARSIELDLHRGSTQHSFRVYHAIPGDTLCDSFEECLGIVRMFQRTMPDHHPLVVYLELKELFQLLFDDNNYTAEDVDRILEAELGPLLYRPAEFLKPCLDHGISTLFECATQVGWPSVAELRGRIIVVVMGSWDELGGMNSVDWARYATDKPIASRTGFPLIATWQLDWNQLDPGVQQRVTDDELQAAKAQSIFHQALGPNDDAAVRALAEGRLVRMDNSYSIELQHKVISEGMQHIQTDTPWIRYDDGHLDLSLHPFSAQIDPASLRESENRLQLVPNATDPKRLVFASTQVPDESTTTWETVVSVGTETQRIGCLRAARDAGSSDEMSISLCRQLLPMERGPDSVGEVLRVSICETSSCTTEEYKSADGTMGGPGELIALDVQLRGGQSCVTARAARLVDVSMNPLWTPLGSMHCLPAALRTQGISRLGITTPTQQDSVSFFNTRRDGKLITAGDLITH